MSEMADEPSYTLQTCKLTECPEITQDAYNDDTKSASNMNASSQKFQIDITDAKYKLKRSNLQSYLVDIDNPDQYDTTFQDAYSDPKNEFFSKNMSIL